MDSHKTGGLISTNIIWSPVIVRYTTEDRYTCKVVSDVVEKNVDSSSKSNPLRRRGKNYDALTWRRRRCCRKKRSRRNFNENSCDLLTAI